MNGEEAMPENPAPAWLDSAFLESVLRDDEQDAGLIVTRNTITYVVGKGDNYLSLMLRVHVEFTRSSGEQSNKYLVVKSLPAGEFMQNLVEEFKAFQHETTFYLKTMPAMMNLMRQRTSKKAQPIIARGYVCSRPNTLVFEDLKQQGFIMCDRRAQLDFLHSKLVLQALGKFHGKSVALYMKDPTFINDYKERIYSEETYDVGKKCVYMCIKDLTDIVASWQGFERFEEKLRHLAATGVSRMIELLKPQPGAFRVLNHGDLWTNNIMFRYSDATGEVEDIRLVDFQMMRFATPAFDLYYFLYTSPRPEVRINHWEELLREYHASLSQTLAALGCVHEGISFGQLLEEMEKNRLFAVITACTILTPILADPNDAIDLSTLTVGDVESGELNVMVQAQSSPKYKNALQSFLLEFEEKGMI